MQEHLGHQVQGRAEVPARDLGRGDQRLPAGVGVDLGAEPLGRLDEGDRVAFLGALGQGARQ